MNRKSKAISEGAMMLALLGIVMMIDRYSAGMFEMLLFLVSIPLVAYTVRYDVFMGMTLSVAAVLISLLLGTFTAMFYLSGALLMGVIYGYGMHKGWSNSYLFSCTLCGNLLVTYLTVFVFTAMFGFDLEADVLLMKNLFEGSSGIDITQIIWTSIVFANLLLAFMQAIIVHVLSHQLLKRLRLPYRELKRPMDIVIPRWFSFVGMIVYILYYVAILYSWNAYLMNLMLTLYCCILLVTLFDGIMFVIWYRSRKGKRTSKGMVFLLMIGCMIPIVQTILSLLGLYDIYFRFRWNGKKV